MSKKTKQCWPNINNWVGLIGGLTGIASLLISYCTFSNQRANEIVEGKIQEANSIFENAGIQDTVELRKAFNKYKEIIQERPAELTGYKNFMNLAKDRRRELNVKCDVWIHWYLLRAQELYDNKTVQDILKQCMELDK